LRTRSFLSAFITTTSAAFLALPSQPAAAVHCPTFGTTRDAGTIADGSLNELSCPSGVEPTPAGTPDPTSG
jgi:hypothetical protein